MNALSNTNNPTPPDEKRAGLQIGHAILSFAVPIAFVAFCGAMAYAVWHLGTFYNQPEAYRWLTAGGCALGVVGHGAAATRARGTNAARMMHGISLGTWLVLSVFLAALYMVTSSPTMSRALPPEMVSIGEYVYALAFGLGLFTSTLALVIPSAAAHPLADGSHATIGAALSKFGEPVVIILAIAASSLHLFGFGQNVARLNMFSVIAAMVIADLSFLVAEKKTISELRSRHENGRYDKFDLLMWGMFGLLVLGYLVVVNIYAVRFTSGTLNMADSTLHTVIDFYAASPSILILCLAALALITALVDNPAGVNAHKSEITISKPLTARAAARIRAQREGWGELTSAVKGRAASAEITPLETLTMTATAPDTMANAQAAAEVTGGESKS